MYGVDKRMAVMGKQLGKEDMRVGGGWNREGGSEPKGDGEGWRRDEWSVVKGAETATTDTERDRDSAREMERSALGERQERASESTYREAR